MRRTLMTLAAAALLLASIPATASAGNVTQFRADLSTGAELHEVVGSSAHGHAIFKLKGDTVTFQLTVVGLSGPAWGAHIHGPADATQNAGIKVPLCGLPAPTAVDTCTQRGNAMVVRGSFTATQEVIDLMTAGMAYVNVHTDLNAPGEVRGQIGIHP